MATTTTTTEILTIRQPSDRLKQAINNCSLGFKKLADAIHEALELGKQEGFSPKEIGKMIRLELKSNNFSDSTIRRYLPAEAKMLSKVRKQVGEFAINLTAKSGPEPKLLPKDYQTDDLPTYKRQFLIDIIHYLEQSSSTQFELEKRALRPLSNKVHEQVAKQVIQLHAKGKSSRAIATQLGIGKTSVLRILNRNNN